MFQKLEKFNKILFPITVIVILVLVGVLFWLQKSGEEIQVPEETGLSDRAEIFNISGKEAGNFLEVIFDPFEVKEGEKQKIIVSLKNPNEIQSFKVILEDGNGIQEKEFKQILLQEEENQASYQIIWSPEELESGKSYPVKFKYATKSGGTNEMSLFWHAESF